MSKNASAAHVSLSLTVLTSVPALFSAPVAGAPAPPPGYQPEAVSPPKPAPTQQQIRDVGDVARELGSPSYADDFGKRAPEQKELCSTLDTAKAWSDEVAATERWLEFAQSQKDLAWTEVGAKMRTFGQEFALASAHDSGVAARYPQTRDFLDVRKVSAARAVATRTRAKKQASTPAPAPVVAVDPAK